MKKKTNLISSLLVQNDHENRINEITDKIIGGSFRVANNLGAGFLEKVYENALAHEIRKAGFFVEQQRSLKVFYDKVIVGAYSPDLLVEDLVIVELKAVNRLEDTHKAQCLNYLNATGLEICLLINFGNPKVDVKRIRL
ncbi:MAG: GxxExxY protein [Pyrinomonadaceae bacterium]|nr:GxxExxY protein [Pyrinomonadaceae bacterium]